jgi:hypothetical protein
VQETHKDATLAEKLWHLQPGRHYGAGFGNRRNLELTETLRDQSEGSLLWCWTNPDAEGQTHAAQWENQPQLTWKRLRIAGYGGVLFRMGAAKRSRSPLSEFHDLEGW